MSWENDFSKMEKGASPTSGVLVKWVLIFVPVLIILGVVGFALNSLGLFGRTVVERKVFENSYQYSEARKTAIATYEAQLVEIQNKLSRADLDPDTRGNLEAQASAIRIKLMTERSKQ